MKIYDDYLKTIRTAISADKKVISKDSSFSAFSGESLRSRFNFSDLNKSVPPKRLLPSLDVLANELGLKPDFDQQLGLHPDFAYLKGTDRTENHYIVSAFIDIKGSTNLFAKYEPETVLIINTTIQRAAIHTCLIFGGYIHRLQGDGLFVYFGGKGVDKKMATLRALQSASVFTYFVKHDLKNLFLEQGIDKIFTRIGIDFGDDADVTWSMAGIGEISEVTTCSLHTSLASKMQAYAESNGIVVGDKVKSNTDFAFQDLMTPVSKRTEKEQDRYIFRIPEEGFFYTQYDLDWMKFLKKQDFIATNLHGDLSVKRKTHIAPEREVKNLEPIAVKSKPYLNGSKK
ncbi:hypothetical protein [Mangrovibacterium marinum]|uniref:adenylate/guanylate cyclase domain-containing protein n=1 Tax=Mangrovibacterium marinum TaxID=1639118 RepID=UPI002A18E188|nr:hypothetical protein [Mangrovibacterium marinum]